MGHIKVPFCCILVLLWYQEYCFLILVIIERQLVRLQFIFIYIFFLSLGFFGFLLHKNILVVEFFWPSSIQQKVLMPRELQKKVLLFYPHHEQFESEEKVMMWQQENLSLMAKHLSNLWFALLFDEGIFAQSYNVQEVLVNELGTELYISVDKNFLHKAWSIAAKWRLVESLLKTIKYACPQIQGIYFLVNFEVMQDTHLDFSHLWPIDGFYQAEE